MTSTSHRRRYDIMCVLGIRPTCPPPPNIINLAPPPHILNLPTPMRLPYLLHQLATKQFLKSKIYMEPSGKWNMSFVWNTCLLSELKNQLAVVHLLHLRYNWHKENIHKFLLIDKCHPLLCPTKYIKYKPRLFVREKQSNIHNITSFEPSV